MPIAAALAPPAIVRRTIPYLALAGSMLIFCVGTSFAKRLFPLVGAEGTTAYRVGFSALVLMLATRPWRVPIARADLFRVMRYGAALGTMNLCFYMALRTLPLGLAIAIEFLGPLSVAMIHSRTLAHFAMAGMAAAGLLLLLPVHPVRHALDPVGIGFALGAGLCWALYIVFGKATGHLPGGQAVALGMATGAIVVVPIGIHHAGAALLTPASIGMGLVAAILSSAVPYSLEMIALKRIPANRFGVLLSAEPAIGALAGVVLLGERLSGLQWVAIALVVGASVGMMLTADPAQAAH